MNLGTTIKVAGGLLPPQLLERIAAGDSTLVGTAASDFHEENGVALNQAINRAWSVLTSRWATFRAQLAQLPESDRATVLTRDKWLLPLFQELGYGRLAPERAAIVADDRPFAISHRWGHLPIHLVGARLSLDKRVPGERGAAASPPHGLVQDLLNHADGHLWAMLSNGLELRLLRDHRSLTRQAYVSFDLEAMFDGEQFSAFRLLYLLCHQSRVEGDDPRQCWLERWVRHAQDDGVRALDRLRGGVEAALTALGRGFIRHRANDSLKAGLGSGALSTQDYYRQLLKLVYRLIFLFVAEDRDLLLVPDAPEAAKDRFRRLYATRRLRTLAIRRRGGPHEDGWQALVLVMRQLDKGNANLALPALGSFLWSTEEAGGKRVSRAIPDLDLASLANEDLYAALGALCAVQDGPVRRPVDWAGVQSDELGSVYEALMERVPRVNLAAGSFELASAAGNERKTTGSYYTPSSLVDCLLDSALDPVLEQAARSADPEKAILDLSVVDPACGSGHFLVAAARRIAHRLARVRCGGIEPSPPEVQHALRDVVGHCIYGVDLNPMAVELCKVSLWMEALEPGRPLSFLDGHIRHGNALLGTTPELMEKGIPDEAWEAIEGDDKEVAKRLKKENRNWKQTGLFVPTPAWDATALAKRAAEVEAVDDTTAAAVEQKEQAWRKLDDSAAGARLLADLWCAAFVWPKQPGENERSAPVRGLWESAKLAPAQVPDATRRIATGLSKQYGFFHWHIAYPRVFERGGFDVVLGNPPYVNIDDTWGRSDPRLALVRGSFPEIYNDKTDLVFYFLAHSSAVSRDAVGLLVSRAFLEAYKADRLRAWLAAHSRVVGIIDFQSHAVFPEVGVAIAAVVLGKRSNGPARYYRARPLETTPPDLPSRREDSAYFEVFDVEQSSFGRASWAYAPPRLDAIVRKLDARGTPLKDLLELGQGMQTGLNTAFDLEASQVESMRLPLSMWRVRLRNSDIDRYQLRDGGKRLLYVEDAISFDELPHEVRLRLEANRKGLEERAACVRGNCEWWRYTWPLSKPLHDRGGPRIWCPYMAADNRFALDLGTQSLGLTDTTVIFDSGQAEDIRYFLAVLNSRVMTFRYAFIGKLKGSVREYFWNGIGELRVPRINFETAAEAAAHQAVVDRVQARLRATTDAAASAAEAEIEAILARRIWRIERGDLEDVFDALSFVRASDVTAHGEYRTKRVVLEIYDAMAEAERSGVPYQTRLDPPPADPRATHPPRESGA